jgi:hypothetical protein
VTLDTESLVRGHEVSDDFRDMADLAREILTEVTALLQEQE